MIFEFINHFFNDWLCSLRVISFASISCRQIDFAYLISKDSLLFHSKFFNLSSIVINHLIDNDKKTQLFQQRLSINIEFWQQTSQKSIFYIEVSLASLTLLLCHQTFFWDEFNPNANSMRICVVLIWAIESIIKINYEQSNIN